MGSVPVADVVVVPSEDVVIEEELLMELEDTVVDVALTVALP